MIKGTFQEKQENERNIRERESLYEDYVKEYAGTLRKAIKLADIVERYNVQLPENLKELIPEFRHLWKELESSEKIQLDEITLPNPIRETLDSISENNNASHVLVISYEIFVLTIVLATQFITSFVLVYLIPKLNELCNAGMPDSFIPENVDMLKKEAKEFMLYFPPMTDSECFISLQLLDDYTLRRMISSVECREEELYSAVKLNDFCQFKNLVANIPISDILPLKTLPLLMVYTNEEAQNHIHEWMLRELMAGNIAVKCLSYNVSPDIIPLYELISTLKTANHSQETISIGEEIIPLCQKVISDWQSQIKGILSREHIEPYLLNQAKELYNDCSFIFETKLDEVEKKEVSVYSTSNTRVIYSACLYALNKLSEIGIPSFGNINTTQTAKDKILYFLEENFSIDNDVKVNFKDKFLNELAEWFKDMVPNSAIELYSFASLFYPVDIKRGKAPKDMISNINRLSNGIHWKDSPNGIEEVVKIILELDPLRLKNSMRNFEKSSVSSSKIYSYLAKKATSSRQWIPVFAEQYWHPNAQKKLKEKLKILKL